MSNKKRELVGLAGVNRYRVWQWVDANGDFVMKHTDEESALMCTYDLEADFPITRSHIQGIRHELGLYKEPVPPNPKASEPCECIDTGAREDIAVLEDAMRKLTIGMQAVSAETWREHISTAESMINAHTWHGTQRNGKG